MIGAMLEYSPKVDTTATNGSLTGIYSTESSSATGFA
jgi:hypothetical protein